MVMFLTELNDMECWSTDVTAAYLESINLEKHHTVGGPEFGKLEGHVLVIYKALYGLRLSNFSWTSRFADCMRDLGFFQCKAEPEIWMRRNGDRYEYVAVFVDDLALALCEPQAFVDKLIKEFKFHFKGTGPMMYHLGMDVHQDDEGVLCMSPTKYIEKLISTYKRNFGEKPRTTFRLPRRGAIPNWTCWSCVTQKAFSTTCQ